VTSGLFVQVGYVNVEARQSFGAVFGESHGATFGGGFHVRFRDGLYIAASFERFDKTGERVFVTDGTVFPLGIEDALTVVPMIVTAGYRLFPRASVVPYVGGGIGTYGVKEKTPFEEADEVPWAWHDSYRVEGGVEFRAGRWVATAVEGQYTKVREALGTGGVSQDFSEHDLGGFTLQFKLILGR
jgi:opacity protein-like surface antigen